MTEHRPFPPGYPADTGQFEETACPLCGLLMKQPIVAVGRPVIAGLSYVLGVGMMHPSCARSYQSGSMQATMAFDSEELG